VLFSVNNGEILKTVICEAKLGCANGTKFIRLSVRILIV
jgi:hypothetical protein